MSPSDTSSRDRAEQSFARTDRADKGTAMNIIKTEADVRDKKSARLKALRLARDADVPAVEPKKPRRKATKA